MNTTAALDAAKARLAVGWPLLVLAVALYSPLGGLARLVLLAAGLFYLSRPTGTYPHRTTQPDKPAPRTRDEKGKWTK